MNITTIGIDLAKDDPITDPRQLELFPKESPF
jgi:hypothetical protein